MSVVQYNYYTSSYGGHLIKESSWEPLANKAEARLKRYTFGKLQEPWPDEVKAAVCEMAECLYRYDKRDGKTAENNDGYSVSYDTEQSLDNLLYDIADVYLGNTEFMSLGVE